MRTKYLGKNPVSGLGAGIKETGFFTEIKGENQIFGKKPGF
ncbi:MAG: hypothetical protein WCD53_04135 [Microcoleus sp.]